MTHERYDLTPGLDWVTTLRDNDLCFVTVIERHGRAGNVAHGLLRAFGLKQGAVASSVGHDSHNVIVAGLNEEDMRVALDALSTIQGGVCVVEDGKVTAMVPLPVAGLLSDKRVGLVAEEVRLLKMAWERGRLHDSLYGVQPNSAVCHSRDSDHRQRPRAGAGHEDRTAFWNLQRDKIYNWEPGRCQQR